MVHSPFEIPGNFEIIDMVEFDYGYDLEVLITPEIIKTDSDFKSYEPKNADATQKGTAKVNVCLKHSIRSQKFVVFLTTWHELI
jgi:hypothetical protein